MRKTIRVAVDLVYLTGRKGGTETYARGLFPALADVDPDLRFVGLTNTETGSRAPDWFPGKVVRLPISGENRIAWGMAEVGLVAPAARWLGADLLHCPANFGPGVRVLPTVVTIHDLLSFRHPELAGGLASGISVLSRLAGAAATRVLTDSLASAADIRQFLNVAADRIDVVPLAASSPPSTEGATALPSGVEPGSRPLVLTTGNRLPHKNFATLLHAWARMPAEVRPLLVITGSHGDDPLRPLVHELQLEKDVELLGWVTGTELEALYRTAALYVCPSLFEGFGLPLLEAMQRGCAVLASDIPVLREVGGDAVRYVDARSAPDLAAAVLQLVTDGPARDDLARRGRELAAASSWHRTAELTAESFRRALGSSRRR